MVRAPRSTADWILLTEVLNNFEKSSVASGDQRILIRSQGSGLSSDVLLRARRTFRGPAMSDLFPSVA